MEEDKMSIVYKKIGEALRYAMYHELPNKECKKHTHLIAVVIYLALYGQISAESMQKILSNEKILLQKKNERAESEEKIRQDEYETRRIIERIIRIVSTDLKEHMYIHGLDNILGVLNQKELPKWLMTSLEKIISLYPNIGIVGDELYFVEKTVYRTHSLMKIPLKEISEFEAIDVEHPSVKDCVSNVIGIINIDFNLGRIDVTVSQDKKFFVEYNCNTGDQKMVDMRFLGVIGECEIGISNGFLCYRLDDKIYHLKEYSDNEKYEVKQGGIKVYPKIEEHTFFCPYIISLDGNIVEIPKNEEKNYLWKMMKHFVLNDENKLDCELEEVTIEKISLSFEKKELLEELCKNPRYAVLQGVFNLLKKYIDKNYDISRLLFLLFDAGLKLISEFEWFIQPFTDKLLWQLRRIELYEDEKLVKDLFGNLNSEQSLDLLKKKLLCNVSFEKKSYEAQVGCFQIDDSGEITRCDTEDISKAGFIGYMRCKNSSSYQSNLVMYYPIDNTYIVQTDKALRDEQKKMIVEKFQLRSERVHFICKCQ